MWEEVKKNLIQVKTSSDIKKSTQSWPSWTWYLCKILVNNFQDLYENQIKKVRHTIFLVMKSNADGSEW